MTRIRKAKSADLEQLLKLEALAFDSDRMSRRSFRRWLQHRHCVFLVSTENGLVTGYLLAAFRRGSRFARIYSLAVAPDYRGRGLASALLGRAERVVADSGYQGLRLEVAESNRAGTALYRKRGYTQFDLYPRYYENGGDALRMEKSLHPQ